MIPNWTANIKDPDEAKKFRRYIYQSKGVLDRLNQIMADMENDLDNQETDQDQYSSPSWAALQADRNGYRRAIRRIKKYTTLDQKED